MSYAWPKGAKKIIIDWLNDLEVLVIFKEKTFDEFVKDNHLEKETIAADWEEANGSVTVLELDEIPYFVCIFRSHDERVIVHESVHLAHAILESKGISAGAENTEVMAYTTDYLFTKIFEIIGT